MIYDISPQLSPNIGVWPGDTPLMRDVLLDFDPPNNIQLSSLSATVHLGAHADAPSHYVRGGQSIESRDLDYYLGKCQVIRLAVPRHHLIRIEDLKDKPLLADRVIFATGTYPDFNDFNRDFAAFDPELIDYLATQGVKLVGIDTPSVDPFASKNLPAHLCLHKNDMAVLEGLWLEGVPEGVYELIALPLRLHGFDASPVRAILRTIR